MTGQQHELIHPCKHGYFDESTLSTFCSKIRGRCYGLDNCISPELREQSQQEEKR
jgi:hypothetical protein